VIRRQAEFRLYHSRSFVLRRERKLAVNENFLPPQGFCLRPTRNFFFTNFSETLFSRQASKRLESKLQHIASRFGGRQQHIEN
jgi:hypothetical protein